MKDRTARSSGDGSRPNQFGWASVVVVFLALIAGASILHYRNGQGPQKVTGPLEPVRIGVSLHPTGALLFIALAKGYFKGEGLDVATTSYLSGKRALLEGLIPGNVDIVSAVDVPVAIAGFAGHEIKVVTSVFTADNVNRIIARRDKGIVTPSDLRGKRIATQGASAVHYFLHLFLLEHGLSEEDVALHFMKAETLPAALAEGRIDAFSMREPFISEAWRLLEGDAVLLEAPGLYSQNELIVAAASLVKTRPQVVARFLRALIRAESFVRTKPEEAIIITAGWLGVEPDKIAFAWPQIRYRIVLDQSLLLRLENVARWAISANIVDSREVPNYLDFIHLDALAEIKPDAVTIIR